MVSADDWSCSDRQCFEDWPGAVRLDPAANTDTLSDGVSTSCSTRRWRRSTYAQPRADQTAGILVEQVLLITTSAKPVRPRHSVRRRRSFIPAHVGRQPVDRRQRPRRAGSSAPVPSARGRGIASARACAVHVVDPSSTSRTDPVDGRVVRELHQSHAVEFHLGTTVRHIEATRITLSDDASLDADLVVAGVGVHPSIALAEQRDRGRPWPRGQRVSRNHVVASLPRRRSRWPDPHSSDRIRVERSVVAERQGGRRRAIPRAAPAIRCGAFFLSQHYDVTISYAARQALGCGRHQRLTGRTGLCDHVHVGGPISSPSRQSPDFRTWKRSTR